jgi:hypothetical protein
LELLFNSQNYDLEKKFINSELGLSEEDLYDVIIELIGKDKLSEHHICKMFREIDCFCRGRSIFCFFCSCDNFL